MCLKSIYLYRDEVFYQIHVHIGEFIFVFLNKNAATLVFLNKNAATLSASIMCFLFKCRCLYILFVCLYVIYNK